MLTRKFKYSIAIALLVLCVNDVKAKDIHSCFYCSDDDCEDDTLRACQPLRHDDQCFMRFDAITHDVVEMGCLSDFKNETEIIELVKRKELLTCKGSECNGFRNLPSINECSKCTSLNLEACATKPTTTTSKTRCSLMPYTQCYQRVIDGATERGCLSDLQDDEFYKCLTGDDDNCKICEGNVCNEDIVPSDRLRCHRCSSLSDTACGSAPAASSACPTYSVNDSCVAYYDYANDVTQRGCATETTCDAYSRTCQLCAGSNCNIANLKKRLDEVYGVFQDLPLNCNTCSGKECQNGLRNPQKCEGDIYQDCLTVFSEQGQVLRRGCENPLMTEYKTYCTKNPDLCFNCKANGCNNVTDHTVHQQCLYCDAASNPDCLFNPQAVTTTRKCALGCVSALYPRKFNPSVSDFVRTCFEDIEPDDHDSCTAAKNCVRCTADKCNNLILPEQKRLSCYHCQGDNCNDPVSRTCLGYAADDQCYMYFDNVTLSAVKMGCRSEYTKSAILADVKQFFICDGDNCNNYSNLPEARMCFVCDSAIDANCAVAPSQITHKSRCQNFPYTECFTRIRDDGHTERGCLHDLSIEDFKTCHDGHVDSKCRLCTESECNKNVYPGNRHSCYHCNSTTDANCESSPDAFQPCLIFEADERCITQWVEGVTRRACASELTCEGYGPKNCQVCSGYNCNDINLAADDIGPVGVFTPLPLSCYHSNGTSDLRDSSGDLKVCQDNIHQPCTVAFNAKGDVIGRGCSEALEEVCQAKGNLCYDCKSNGCNSAKRMDDYIDCIFCDSKNGDDCTFNAEAINRTRKCQKACMTALYPRTTDENPVYELTRSCLDDKDLDDRLTCEESEDPKCKSCRGSKCNKDAVGSHKSCYQCQGDECQDPKIQTCRAVMDNDQCFVQWDEAGTMIAMGCKSQYDPKDVATLVSAKLLWLCDSDNCNHFDNLPQRQKCTLCNSITDNDCATNPNAVKSTTSCDAVPYSQCYSRVLKYGHTERGCLSNLQDDEFYRCLYNKNLTECQSCVGDNCNNAIFPSNRITCHVCSSVSSISCETSPAAPQVCLLYTSEEKCATYIDANGNTIRGCSSEVNCDTSDSSNCVECQGKDCNNDNLKRKSDAKPGQWQELPLKCFFCSSVDDCRSGGTEEMCSDREYCMTVFDDNGNVRKRGCSETVENEDSTYCDSNPDKCFNCNSNLCNVAKNINDYNECVYCNSESNSNCAVSPSTVGRRRKCNGYCMTALYPISQNSSIFEVVRSCLDDKDVPNQEKCLDGDSSECHACLEPSCNIDMLPESRFSCYTCSGVECANAEAMPCLRYSKHEQCYMLFDNKSDIVQMGCISDLEESFVIDNVHRMFRCDNEKNCNRYEEIPQPTNCVVCNSTEDADCATSPQDIPGVTVCSQLPNTQCYTKVNLDGSTERGCVNSLSKDQMMSCLEGHSADCATCNKHGCNKEIFPADRRSCHRCNTKDDPSCENAPDSASVCPIYSATQFCASKLVNGHTYRGCSTEFHCDDSDKQYCRLCHDSNNCNTVDLAATEIGYPGKWQGIPINCYSCQGSECQSTSLGNPKKCENNDLQNCATVFGPNGTVVERGCSDQIYESSIDYCDKNTALCKFCKSSGCNYATSLSDYEDCLFCDGSDNSDCVSSPEDIKRTRSCHKGCMTALYARKEEENPAYELARGCLDDMDEDQRNECKDGSNHYCQTCNGKTCNKVKIPSTRLKCMVCEGDECEGPKSNECFSYRENDQCFTLFQDGNDVQRMGCASQLDTSFLVANGRQLLLCNGDDCNYFDNFPNNTFCRWCNSKDDPECASSPGRREATLCDRLPHTECYVRVDEEGTTHRGCVSDIDDGLYHECSNSSSKTCEICPDDMCNDKVFPEGRRSCIQCDSSEFSACEDNASQFAKTCAMYEENDMCVTKLDGERTLRGCASEITCDTSSRDTCRICNRTDNCNTINLLADGIGDPGKWQGLPLSCHHCEGAQCANENSHYDVCKGNNLQTCATVFALNGTVVKRGCSDGIIDSYGEYCDEHPDHCPRCKSVGCNTVKRLDELNDCHFCDSADSSSCSVDFDRKKLRTRKCQGDCMVALYPRTSDNDTSYELTRTCLNDMDLDDRIACQKGENELCKACTGSFCNTMNVPENRWECYKCLNGDCEEMAIKQCSAYHPQDGCYTLFNEVNSVIAMGCRSEYDAEAIKELVKQKKMLLCNSQKACNSPESLPSAKMCSVCNSEDNPLCATNPNLVANIERCSVLPYTDCYTRVNNYGHTERGCLASLDSEAFYDCHMGNDALCQTCVGDKCNEIDVFPSDRRMCHQCNSATDPLCAIAPNNNKVCAVYDSSDTCITNLNNGVTTRGCSSTVSCDDLSDKRNCRICASNGCNTVNLEKAYEDGEPGRWQAIPIQCHTCNNTDECAAKAELQVCDTNDNPYQNCMIVFDVDGKVKQKGCSDTVSITNEEYCESSPQKCPRCNSNGCNVAENLEEYIDCLFCDTDSSGDCVNNVSGITKTRKCYKHCMTAMYPLFEEENPSYGLSRSCYDDMDKQDRENCANNTKDKCNTCSDDKCNTVEVAKNRRKCFMCQDDSCQDPKDKECPTYRPDDKCYVRFDEKNSIVAHGCRSEFSNNDADYLLKQKRLYLCDNDSCNSIEALPDAQTCALCNSRTDEQCATNPSGVTNKITCSNLPYTQCYSRVLSDGATERGCLSNLLGDDFVDCLSNTSETCKSCKGNDCNKNIFPDNRLKCHICNSLADPNCEASPDSLGLCPLYDAEDTCVSVYRNNVTYRGCSSSLTCDLSNPRACSKCSDDGCNTVNLAKKQDDNFGKWQDLPLTCLSCKNGECDSDESTKPIVCELNNEQDCMTVIDEQGKVVRRGCSDSVEREYGSYCDKNEHNCFSCKSNNCNTAINPTKYVECVYCDTNKNLDCLWNPLHSGHKTRKCQGGCMVALYPSDSSSSPGYDLIRTCLNDKEEKDQEACEANKDAHCKACTGAKCNIDNVPDNRLSCLICKGDSCEDPKASACPLYKENDQCFIQFDDTNSISEMGCISSFRNQELENIIKTKRVYVCSGKNCNSQEISRPQKCVVCNSTNDVACAVEPTEIGYFHTCSMMPYTECYVKIDADGKTLRGCLTDLPENDFASCVLSTDKNCASCSGDGCNNKIFPPDRQQCFTCDSAEESSCESYPESKMVCPIVTDTESCITAISGNVTIRGCSSTVYCDENDSRTCRSCFGSECNSIDLINKVDDGYHGVWQDLPLKCHSCEGEHCQHSLGPVVTCSKRNVRQDCMTVFTSDNVVDRRGCSDDVEDYSDLYCRRNPSLCFKCKSNNCNIAWSVDEYTSCVFCDSASDPMCLLHPETNVFASRRCYKACMVAMKDQQVIRSCLDDKESLAQPSCQDETGNECNSCTEKDCNKFVFPADRLKCHLCSGDSCAGNTTSQYCQIYDKTDFCFAKYENGKVDLMGCATAQNVSDIIEWEVQKKLYKCESNDCNELSRLPTGGECVACDSSKTPNCAQKPLDVSTTESCLAPSEECVTRVDSEGNTIRGCLTNLNESEQSCQSAGTCTVCSGSKCNNQIYPENRLSCHICNSANDNKCATNPNNPFICPTYFANDTCISSLNNNGFITRGCASQITCEKNDKDYCEKCNSNNCNTAELKGSASAIGHSIVLNLLLALAATKLLKRH